MHYYALVDLGRNEIIETTDTPLPRFPVAPRTGPHVGCVWMQVTDDSTPMSVDAPEFALLPNAGCARYTNRTVK